MMIRLTGIRLQQIESQEYYDPIEKKSEKLDKEERALLDVFKKKKEEKNE